MEQATTLAPAAGSALIVVDVQKDFLPGGALAVPAGDQVIEPLNRMIDAFADAGLPVFYCRDWHPRDHSSFRAQGGPWPPHCVANTRGAEFADGLRLLESGAVVSIAKTAAGDAYSAFDGTDMGARLQAADVRRLVVGGLATDYCIKATVLDGKAKGFEVEVLTDAVRAVDVKPGDGQRALQEMQARGAILGSSARFSG